ncbi:NAD(P)H-dependent oxidoreductase [Dyadobacter psychrotolerans]|uniref:Flavodoxin family protein n=1 Tax=Dyadobacter psychrotolerans TaxID=2541721 RepID=A0A4R5E1Q0_9BACT|nr:NAD(P)H-dependent oxidoreductase [Dyadobacter psychrotolerans]TDE17995.1 flavodoxin family protein [Dyadobacter psychrotolerans]
MKIYILLAHPDKESFNGAIADNYLQQALKKGHEVRIQRLGDMQFDPILWKGYKVQQDLEPDLVLAQENIRWCQKWVIVYPIWWGSVPALFKGFLDRTLSSGFAFKYHDNDPFWDKLLKGRSAELIVTSDSPWWWIWLQYRNSDINTIKRATLQFCGITPVKTTRIPNIRFLKDADRHKMLSKIISTIPSA